MEKFKQFLYKTKDFLDKYWKVIVICLGVFLLMGQCSSCNKDNRADNDKSTIDSLRREILHLNDRLGDAQSHNDNFTNIATGNQNELTNTIKELKSENAALAKKVTDLSKTVTDLISANDVLRNDNIRLNKEVVDLMEKLNK